ncbi:MAG: chemotaxis response regulator protein-glutamate methylesterase [Candidatus Altiarchaeales archaeon ex4484_96]|nr:MAG: chemotaxis response regulator protein-glutamate methylesterase [Candidatus Altiarchaeales archaeon ex4484_96]
MKKIRVLVVDDSSFMRKVISDMLSADPGIEVVGTAADGQKAVDKVLSLDPDVVTMDIDMPVMDGISAVKQIMKQRPKPVLMVSAFTYDGAAETIKSLDSGAVDFVTKPDKRKISFRMKDVQKELIAKTKAAYEADLHCSVKLSKCSKHHRITKKTSSTSEAKTVVVLGASTGGPKTLCKIITRLPEKINAAVIIVQHMPPKFTTSLARWFDSLTPLHVVEAQDGDLLIARKVYIAPGGLNLRILKEKIKGKYKNVIRLDEDPDFIGIKPSIDVTMESVAKQYGANIIGVILTGMGKDGTKGMKKIKQAGGQTIAQDERTSIIYSMPKSAIESGAVNEVVALPDIASRIWTILNS